MKFYKHEKITQARTPTPKNLTPMDVGTYKTLAQSSARRKTTSPGGKVSRRKYPRKHATKLHTGVSNWYC